MDKQYERRWRDCHVVPPRNEQIASLRGIKAISLSNTCTNRSIVTNKISLASRKYPIMRSLLFIKL